MKRYLAFITLGVGLVLLSALTYTIHYLIFRDARYIFMFFFSDLGFLPLQVVLVVIIVERLLARREKQAVMAKLNMVIGAFFSEVGSELLRRLVDCFETRQEMYLHLAVSQDWNHNDFKRAIAFASAITEKPRCFPSDLEELKAFLVEKRPFLLALLENPNLLEHDRFTNLLWATFHVTEELEARKSLQDLPVSDLAHLGGDITRAFGHVATEWVYYTEHMKQSYPYLFSLVSRTHPFQEHPSPVVKE